jgi:hypothetical protein
MLMYPNINSFWQLTFNQTHTKSIKHKYYYKTFMFIIFKFTKEPGTPSLHNDAENSSNHVIIADLYVCLSSTYVPAQVKHSSNWI